MAKQSDNFPLTQHEPGYFAVNAPNDIQAAAKVFRANQLFQKKLLNADFTLILCFLCFQIKFNSIRRNRIDDISVLIAAFYEPGPPPLLTPSLRFIVFKIKGMSLICQLVKYVLSQGGQGFFISLNVKVSDQQIADKSFIGPIGYLSVIETILFNKKRRTAMVT